MQIKGFGLREIKTYSQTEETQALGNNFQNKSFSDIFQSEGSHVSQKAKNIFLGSPEELLPHVRCPPCARCLVRPGKRWPPS